MTALALRAQRAKIVAEARDILNKETVTAEDEAAFDRAMDAADALVPRIEALERRAERQAGAEAELARVLPAPAGRGDSESPPPAAAAGEGGAFRAWLRGGLAALAPEQRADMAARQAALPAELRAQGIATGAAGGFMVPQDFRAVLEKAMLAFGGMREAATVIRTSTGAALPMPTVNDTAQTGALLAENTATAEQDVTFGAVTLDSFMYTSKLVRVSLQLLQDEAFPADTWLAGLLGERLGRITNAHFTTGTGSGQPNGVVTASTLGKTGLAGQTLSIIFDDLVDLEHSVDPNYRRGARFMMHDSSLKVVKKLKDSQNRPLWLPGLATREPDTILGYGFTVNQDVAVMAANAKSVLFGDFTKYVIRSVLDIQMMRLVERYADLLQVGFLAFLREDGDLLNAGTNPVKHYANSAT